MTASTTGLLKHRLPILPAARDVSMFSNCDADEGPDWVTSCSGSDVIVGDCIFIGTCVRKKLPLHPTSARLWHTSVIVPGCFKYPVSSPSNFFSSVPQSSDQTLAPLVSQVDFVEEEFAVQSNHNRSIDQSSRCLIKEGMTPSTSMATLSTAPQQISPLPFVVAIG